MEAIKTSVTNSPAESEVKGKAVKKSGKRIGYNYIILRSLKKSQKNDVVTCLYIKSLTNFGICVIKEGTYGDSKDKQGRDIKDRLVWQNQLHESLQDKVRLPRLLGSFEENGNYYLVLERIKGKSLYKACKEAGKDLRGGLITGNKLGMKFLDYMIQMISLLETLHQHGIVHRDVTATNFMITPAGKVAVIDMELSYSLLKGFPDPPFQLGTYGYMSPEQEAMAMPAYDQDVFSMAAIILLMWTDISPSKLTTNTSFDEMSDKVRLFIPDKEFAEIIIQCLHPEPGLRPSLQQLKQVTLRYKNDLQQKSKRPVSHTRLFSRDEILQTIQQSIVTLSSPLLADNDKGWFAENTNVPESDDKKKIVKSWYASFAKGASGVIYTLSKANMVGMDVGAAQPYIQMGLNLVEKKYINKLPDINPSYYFGGSGIAATMATAIREGLIEPQTEYFDWINRLLELPNQVLGFQHGIAGQGIAYLLSHPFLHREKVEIRLREFVARILAAQENDGSWIRSGKGRKKRITKGFALGVTGIIYFLMEYSKQFNEKDSLHGAEKGLGWLIRKAVREKDSILWTSSSGKTLSPWFSEGILGIALLFIKAYALTGETKYRQYAEATLRSHEQNVIVSNLSFDNGLCGLGEVCLEGYRVLGNEEYLDRAGWIANFLMHMKMNQKGKCPYWIIQHERQPVPDFVTGNSGIIHFLLRYCYPGKIGFPLLIS